MDPLRGVRWVSEYSTQIAMGFRAFFRVAQRFASKIACQLSTVKQTALYHVRSIRPSIRGSGDDVPPTGRASNRLYPFSAPLKRLADCSTSLCIPDSNGPIKWSVNDVPSIGRVSDRQHKVSAPLERLFDCSTSLSTAYLNGAVLRSRENVSPIGRVGDGPQPASVSLERPTAASVSVSQVRIAQFTDPGMMCRPSGA